MKRTSLLINSEFAYCRILRCWQIWNSKVFTLFIKRVSIFGRFLIKNKKKNLMSLQVRLKEQSQGY